MIKISNEVINSTIEYLNENYNVDEEVFIKIAEGYDVIEAPNGERGFGVYDPETRTIYVPTEMEDEELIRTIAHEYRHFMQYNGNDDIDEVDAEEFADMIVEEMRC